VVATRVVVQQRHRLFREGLRHLLEDQDDIELCGTAAGAEDLVQLCAEQRPEIVLIEADASGWDVARLCATLRRAHPGLRLVGLSPGPNRPAELAEAKRCGMSALVSRRMGVVGILGAFRAAMAQPQRGNVTVIRSSALAESSGRMALTDRELHVLELVGAGCTSREISHRLGISHKTVENHKQRVFGKLGVQNQAHAVSVAMRAGMLRADHVLELSVGD
jgi:DNA-binding NarL/FixJ family response regulator